MIPTSAVSTIVGVSKPQGLAEDNVLTTLTAPDGSVWLGFFTHGVDVVSPRDGHVVHLRSSGTGAGDALPKATVRAFAPTSSGDIFIGTDAGLFRAGAAGEHLHRVTIQGSSPTARVQALWVDGGQLWMGGMGGL